MTPTPQCHRNTVRPNDKIFGVDASNKIMSVTFSSTSFATGTGTTGSTVINFPQQIVMAIRIKDTGSVNGTWWSIGELQTTCSM
jgi:hypothetical protein